MLNKKRQKSYSKKITNNTHIIKILLFLITISLSVNVTSQSLYTSVGKLIFDSKIILTIKGKNKQQILYNNFNPKPSEILINNEIINTIDYYVNLEFDDNNITIKFNETITSCKKMFYNLPNIIKIVFIKFDSSKVTDMGSMFYFCTNLKSLDLNSINTSLVTNMEEMLRSCINLISLNLKDFNTSSVTNMQYMFSGCISLNSIDLSNFIISSVTNM